MNSASLTAMKKCGIVLGLVVLFFAVRVHFYHAPLMGEEGIFADMVVNQPSAPDFLLSGRVDGQNIYHWPAHPLAMYYMVRAAGTLFSPLISQASWQDDPQITPVLRLVFSFSQFAVFLALALLAAYCKTIAFRTVFFLLAAVIISPTAVITSANLQIDGSIGVLMAGFLALTLLYLCLFQPLGKVSGLFLFAASFFLATGKQEWSIIVLLALVPAAVYVYINRSHDPAVFRADRAMLLIILAGLMAGHVFSYLLSPQSYLGGLEFLWSFSHADKALDGRFDTHKWMVMTISRLRWICVPLILIAIAGTLAIGRFRTLKTAQLVLLLLGLGFFVPFFLSSHNDEARYFAPSLVVLTAAVIALLPSSVNLPLKGLTVSMILLIVAADFVFLYNNIVVKPQRPYFEAAAITLEPDQMAILSTAQAWNKTGIDFVNLDDPRQSGEKIAKRYNKRLYPQDYVWWSDPVSSEAQPPPPQDVP